MKPKHSGGYTNLHNDLCERTLVTLLRGLGPWKSGVYLVGGLVPRYLIPQRPDHPSLPLHVGTTDVDIVLDLDLLAEVEAYRRLERNLTELGFERGKNDDDRAQHFSWRKPAGNGITVVVDLLCEPPAGEHARVVSLPGERRLSALALPGAHLVFEDHVELELSADLLDGRGVATESIRVAGIVPFVVLKALAIDDRYEEKDAYDLVYCLSRFEGGPAHVGSLYAERKAGLPDEPLLRRAVSILRRRFATDATGEGFRKDGPTSYARFLAEPGQPDRDVRNRRDAAAIVEAFLAAMDDQRE